MMGGVRTFAAVCRRVYYPFGKLTQNRPRIVTLDRAKSVLVEQQRRVAGTADRSSVRSIFEA
jgi:hypothetical protein